MKGLTTLVAGAVLSSSLYAAEPSLHTTPDPGVPLVQENADKALKVAYMVAGQMCKTGISIGLGMTTEKRDKQAYHSQLFVENNNRVYEAVIFDNQENETDLLRIVLFPEKISLGAAKGGRGMLGALRIDDEGLDGHINHGVIGINEESEYLNLARDSGGKSYGIQHEEAYQQSYISALDKIITACEGKQ